MPPEIKTLLQSIGLNDKEVAVYSAILPLGSASVRAIADRTGINRGTVHDILDKLLADGLLSCERYGEKRKFVAESPDKVLEVLERRAESLSSQKRTLEKAMPKLMSFYAKQGGRPSVEYFDDDEGIKKILEDVLAVTEKLKDKIYFVYSSRSVRGYLYKLFPGFTKEKIKRGISTQVIALGEGGDPTNMKLAERRWIKEDAPAYILIYGNKVALISVAEDEKPFGVLINDAKIADTQKIIFQSLWERLARRSR